MNFKILLFLFLVLWCLKAGEQGDGGYPSSYLSGKKSDLSVILICIIYHSYLSFLLNEYLRNITFKLGKDPDWMGGGSTVILNYPVFL